MNEIIKNKSLFLFFLTFVIFFYLVFLINLTKQVLINQETEKVLGQSVSSITDVSLSIGESRFTLFGYTSPHALVTFSGLGISDQTYANDEGYFVFKNRFSPLSPREACLTAQDQLGRLSLPLCLPAFPTSYNVEIGPVIMPPTISLNKENYWVGDQIILSGQTIPEKTISLSIFAQQKSENSQRIGLTLIKEAEAFSFPKIETTADKKGNFSITLPSSSAKKYRLFTQVYFKGNQSPESTKLSVRIYPWWMIIFKFIGLIFDILKNRLLELALLTQLVFLIFFTIDHFFNPYHLAKNRAIILRQSWPIALIKKE